jgi:transcriptional regulator with XRE-family HTH domain
MPRAITVRDWKEKTGRTVETVAKEAGVSVRAAIRYLNDQRAWPFEAVRRLKKVSGHKLTDASFDSAA